MTKVKVCGITRLEDALHAAACGAEMLGFNFYRKSPRYVSPDAARKIIVALPTTVETVGVFVNERNAAEVRKGAEQAGVTSVQLHGDEDVDFCAALSDLHPIKAIRVGERLDHAAIATFADFRILLDSPSAIFGGSGKAFNWESARAVREQVRYLLIAGGLDARNVRECIDVVAPDVVDACSRLEISPGIKDPQKVAQFIATAHASSERFSTKGSS